MASEMVEAAIQHADKGATVLVLLVTWALTKNFWKEYRVLCASHKDDIRLHKKEYAGVIDRTITCIDKNTEANTKLSESINNLRR